MPYIEIPSHQFIDEARQFVAKHPVCADSVHHKVILPLIAKDHGNNFVGCGKDKFVFIDPSNSDRVVSVAFRSQSPVEAKMAYYLHNIYSSLWPYNFPHVYAASGSIIEEDPTIRITERIKGKTSKRRGSYNYELFSEHEPLIWSNIEHPFREVTAACNQYRIPLPIDRYLENFIAGDNGGEYYVDTINPHALKQPFPIKNVVRFMRESGFEKSQRQSVYSKMKRFNQLFKEYQAELTIGNS